MVGLQLAGTSDAVQGGVTSTLIEACRKAPGVDAQPPVQWRLPLYVPGVTHALAERVSGADATLETLSNQLRPEGQFVPGRKLHWAGGTMLAAGLTSKACEIGVPPCWSPTAHPGGASYS
jgi:hypothetical protein